MLKYFLSIVCLATAFAATPITECNSGAVLPSEVDFNGCTVEPCEISHGSIIAVDVSFTADRELDGMTVDVLATALGIDIPYPLLDHDVCAGLLDETCPVAEGTEVTYHTEIEIIDILPQVPVGLTITISDGEENAVNCFHISAQIV